MSCTSSTHADDGTRGFMRAAVFVGIARGLLRLPPTNNLLAVVQAHIGSSHLNTLACMMRIVIQYFNYLHGSYMLSWDICEY
jgi:hypothetical protein